MEEREIVASHVCFLNLNTMNTHVERVHKQHRRDGRRKEE